MEFWEILGGGTTSPSSCYHQQKRIWKSFIPIVFCDLFQTDYCINRTGYFLPCLIEINCSRSQRHTLGLVYKSLFTSVNLPLLKCTSIQVFTSPRFIAAPLLLKITIFNNAATIKSLQQNSIYFRICQNSGTIMANPKFLPVIFEFRCLTFALLCRML